MRVFSCEVGTGLLQGRVTRINIIFPDPPFPSIVVSVSEEIIKP